MVQGNALQLFNICWNCGPLPLLTAALESGKLWAEDKIIWFMMGRYKVTAREVETMTGGRFYSGLNAVFTSLSTASVKPLVMSVLFCFHLTHCPFLCKASLHHHQAV